MNVVRAVLHEKQVPKSFWPEAVRWCVHVSFWPEAVRWCVHVQNRSPTSGVDQQTPEEIWSGVKPRVDYFRIFGCVAHTHVPDQKRHKLDDKSLKCVLLGVSDESKAYKLFDPISKKVIGSRDVVFEEDKSWNWHGHAEENKANVLDWEDKETEEDAELVQHELIDRYDSNQDVLEPPSNLESNANQDSPVDALPVEGRVTRTRRQPAWMTDYETNLSTEEESLMAMMIANSDDPHSFEEARTSLKWREAMNTEMKAIEKNNT